MVQKYDIIKLLVLFLGFSCLLSSLAVLATRGLNSNEEYPSSLSSSSAPVQDEDLTDLGGKDELLVLEVGEGFTEGRMDLESTDYPGTGANNHHDPRTPGRA